MTGMIENELLARHTSWRIGGPARYYQEARTTEQLQDALAWAQAHNIPTFVLGSGTNVLALDNGFSGLVIRYTAREWEVRTRGEQPVLYVEAGAPVAGTVRRIATHGWGGLTWAEGLPGSFGGAVYGNAGCYGGDMARVLERAWLLVGPQVELWTPERLAFDYRTSAVKQWDAANGPRPIVLAAELCIHEANPSELAATMARIAAERKSKTPWGRSCGSVFKNPPPTADGTRWSAGQLIDRAGLKGTRIGGAEISTVHGNYIVNREDASAADVLNLIDMARRTVQDEFGITLELEVQLLGDIECK
ncbi:MAG: UDP-N-acetylmuramate dehydrogenase [Chloroflexaceae bacterium]|nr:UDP-N-acetylmuramate dehydrogenase [Chloroflexaceae bacterium]